jgi:nucleotidyltransferase substrate binding protein (TIGR01987 family)
MNKINIINQVKEIILKHTTPNRIYLYGSQANGEAKVGSDIDIAYDAPDFKSNYLIEEEVDKIETLLKIDVKNIAKTEERFKNRVKSSGKVIYSATKQLRAEDGLYNFASALEKYESVVKRYEEFKSEGFGDVYLDLIVKRFEFTYEMSWKALKRYLEFLGFEVKNPRQTFKEGYAQQILDNENIWLDMIEQRNLSSHIYDEIETSEILDKKENYLKAFQKLKIQLEIGLINK